MNHIEAYRLYDRDIPEFPFIVDRYKDYFVVYDKSNLVIDRDKEHLPLLISSINELFHVPDDHIILKIRKRREEIEEQYTKLAHIGKEMVIRESQAEFYVNIHDYLDTGIFLDHRPVRQNIFKNSKGKNILNLFCYTGTVSVFAALGGAHSVTSVDMSNTYLSWAKRNFQLNHINLDKHFFISDNVLEYLGRQSRGTSDKFNLIFLDPPTFSNSKKMSSSFDVERDQDFLIDSCMKILAPDGILLFSNNKRTFKLNKSISDRYLVKDISRETIPQDFHDLKIHQCYQIKLH